MKGIIWIGGEVSEGAAVQEGTYTTTLENVYMNEQKAPVVRESSKALARTYVGNYKGLIGSFIGAETQLSAYATDDERVTVFVIYYKGEVRHIPYQDSKLVHDNIQFFEVRKTYLVNPKNVTEDSDNIILVCGFDKLIYVTNFRVLPFYIFKNFGQDTQSVHINNPIGVALLQSRLFIPCTGPDLAPGGKDYEPTRVLASVTGTIDDFRYIPAGASTSKIAIDYVIMTRPGERFLALTSIGDIVIITTTLGIRKISSGRDDNPAISADAIASDDYRIGDCIAAPAFEFSIYLVVATKRTLKAKNFQQVYSRTKTENIDAELPLLASMDSDILNISLNSSTQTIDCFLADGSVRSMHFQSIVPSGSAPMSLPITTTHKHDRIRWSNITGHNSIIEYYHDDRAQYPDWLFFTEKSSELGLLSEAVTSITWEMNVLPNSPDTGGEYITVELFEQPERFPIDTYEVFFIYINVDSNRWVGCLFSHDNIYQFDTYIVEKIPPGAYKAVLIFNAPVADYLPVPFCWMDTTASLHSTEYTSKFYSTTEEPIGLDQYFGVLHDLKLLVSLTSCTGVIGWRNLEGLVKPLTSQKGKLVFKCPEVRDLLEFSSNHSSEIKSKYLEDYGEIDFSLSKNQRYGENKILFKPISHSKLYHTQKFIHLIAG